MSKHSIRIGSDSRFSVSRSSSSDSSRRARFVSATNVSGVERELRVLLRELLQTALLAALGRANLDTRAAVLRQESLERRRVAHTSRNDDLLRDRRRDTVVLEAELLEHLAELFPRSVLEMERVAVDHPTFA